jgi:hypothetical protein
MWREVERKDGERRELELKADILAKGCRVERFRDTYESAWSVIGHLWKNKDDQQPKATNKKGEKGKDDIPGAKESP